jgi:hypothetical protein
MALYNENGRIPGIREMPDLIERLVSKDSLVFPKLNIGSGNTVTGKYATAKGKNCEASGDYSHAQGYLAESYNHNIDEWFDIPTKATKRASHAVGLGVQALGMNSHAEGKQTEGSGVNSHAEGAGSVASGGNSHAEGNGTTASGDPSHAEGAYTTASASWSHAEGLTSKADHSLTHAAGRASLTEGEADHVHGGDNEGNDPATSNNLFRINGNGVNGAAGDVTASGSFSGGGADYAESFEWNDGNPDNEDRAGYFVSLVNGDKIEISGADPIGIVSPLPAVLGDAQYLKFKQTFETDDFGRTIRDPYQVTTYVEQEETDEDQERVEYEVYKDPDGNLFTEVPNPTNKSGTQFTGELPSDVTWDETVHVKRVDADFNPNKEYTNRHERPEWDAIGLLGKLIVFDDGNASAGDKVTPKADGTAEKSGDSSGYHVLKRVSGDKVQVLFK